jgi:hypothetical protein
MRIWIPIVCLLCGTAVAQAQAPAKKELVSRMVQAQQAGIENIGKMLAAQTSQRALAVAGRVVQRMPADKRQAAAKDVQAEVKQFYDEVEPQLRERAAKLGAPTLSPIYEERFSEDELRQIVAWLESPVSKKFQQVDAEAAKALAQKVVADMRPSVEPRLKALEKTVADRLGVQAGSAAAASAPKR